MSCTLAHSQTLELEGLIITFFWLAASWMITAWSNFHRMYLGDSLHSRSCKLCRSLVRPGVLMWMQHGFINMGFAWILSNNVLIAAVIWMTTDLECWISTSLMDCLASRICELTDQFPSAQQCTDPMPNFADIWRTMNYKRFPSQQWMLWRHSRSCESGVNVHTR